MSKEQPAILSRGKPKPTQQSMKTSNEKVHLMSESSSSAVSGEEAEHADDQEVKKKRPQRKRNRSSLVAAAEALMSLHPERSETGCVPRTTSNSDTVAPTQLFINNTVFKEMNMVKPTTKTLLPVSVMEEKPNHQVAAVIAASQDRTAITKNGSSAAVMTTAVTHIGEVYQENGARLTLYKLKPDIGPVSGALCTSTEAKSETAGMLESIKVAGSAFQTALVSSALTMLHTSSLPTAVAAQDSSDDTNDYEELLLQNEQSGVRQHPARRRHTSSEKGGIWGGGAMATDEGETAEGSPKKTRLLMREWLLEQANRGDIPGLAWYDPPHNQLLRVPWIHGSKSGWSPEYHSRLFELWAIHSGKYHPERGEQANPKRWKANFRCALNSLANIQEDKLLSQINGRDGYKVYRILPDAPNPSRGSHRAAHHGQVDSRGQLVIMPEKANASNIGGKNRGINILRKRSSTENDDSSSKSKSPAAAMPCIPKRVPLTAEMIQAFLHNMPRAPPGTLHLRPVEETDDPIPVTVLSMPAYQELIKAETSNISDYAQSQIDRQLIGGDQYVVMEVDSNEMIVMEDAEGCQAFTSSFDVSEIVIGEDALKEEREEEVVSVERWQTVTKEQEAEEERKVHEEEEEEEVNKSVKELEQAEREETLNVDQVESNCDQRSAEPAPCTHVASAPPAKPEMKIPTCVTSLEDDDDDL